MKRKPRGKAKGPTKTFQALAEDVRIIDELRAKLEARQGPVSDSSLIRMGLRKLAESEGINVVQP